VFAGDAYERCLHGIQKVAAEQLDGSVVNRDSGWVRGAAVNAAAGDGADSNGPVAAAAAAAAGAAAAAAGGGAAEEEKEAAGGAAAGAAAAAAAAGGEGGFKSSSNDKVLPRTGERLSLTIRRVLKVHKGLRLPGVGR